jgi:hypothetical protein
VRSAVWLSSRSPGSLVRRRGGVRPATAGGGQRPGERGRV